MQEPRHFRAKGVRVVLALLTGIRSVKRWRETPIPNLLPTIPILLPTTEGDSLLGRKSHGSIAFAQLCFLRLHWRCSRSVLNRKLAAVAGKYVIPAPEARDGLESNYLLSREKIHS
jgi:hypothetical protein